MTTLALAERYSSLRFDELPEVVDLKAKQFLLDTLGVAVGGVGLPSSAVLSGWVTELGGREESSVIGGGRVPAMHAALVNATMAHGLELDDVDNASSLHPGTVVVPTALAAAEASGGSGAEVLTAIVAGYDAIARIGRATGAAEQYSRGFHPTATCGALAAAVTASRVMGLDADAMARALGVAGSFSSGNLEYMTNGAWTKRLQVGGAAQAGVLAASLAAKGYLGPMTILEGPSGFLKQHSSSPQPRLLEAGLSEPWGILDVSIKPFACCRYSQAPVDAAIELAMKHNINPDEIERVDVGIVSAGMPIVARPRGQKINPQNSIEAQFSLHFAVAVALGRRSAFIEDFSAEVVADPAVRRLLPLVHARADQDLDAFYPERWPARVKVTLRGGTSHEAMLKTCLGDPDKPLTGSELKAKFEALAKGHLDEGARSELVKEVRDLDRAADVSALMARLREVRV